MRAPSLLAFAILLSALSIRGGEIEIDVGSTPPGGVNLVYTPQTPGTLVDYYLYTGSGGVHADWSAVESITLDGGVLTIGSAMDPAAAAGLALDMSNASLIIANYLDRVNVASSRDADGTVAGTSVRFDVLAMPYGGTLVIGDGDASLGEAGRNRVEFREFVIGNDGAQGGITLGRHSTLSFTGDGGTVITGFNVSPLVVHPFVVAMSEGSVLSARGGLTLEHARIVGSGEIADDVTLNSNFVDLAGNAGATAEIVVAGGETQRYGGDVSIGELGGAVTATGTAEGAALLQIAGALEVDGSFAGSSVVAGGATFPLAGRIEVGDLRLTNGGKVEVGRYGVLVVGDGAAPGRTGLDGGAIDVGADGFASFHNAMDFSGDALLRVHDGGVAVFSNEVVLSERAGVVLERGALADFSAVESGVRLNGGFISSTAGDNAATVGVAGMYASAPDSVRVASASLSLYEIQPDVAGGIANGLLFVDAAGALALANGGTLGVGALVVTENVGAAGAPAGIYAEGSEGALAAATFAVASGADVVGNADVATSVTGAALVAGTYRAVGDGMVFHSGVRVEGSLAASGDAVVRLGSTDGVSLELAGGTLDASSGALTLRSAAPEASGAIVVTGGTGGASGLVDASDFALNVAGNLTLADAAELAVASYSQSAGATTGGASGAGLRVLDAAAPAVVSGAGASFSANAVFGGGAVFLNGAVLAGGGNVVSASVAGVASIYIDATSRLELTGGSLTISGLKSVQVDGVFSLGYNADASVDAAYGLTLEDGAVLAFGEGARIEMDDAFIAAVSRNGDFESDGGGGMFDMITGGRVILPESAAEGWTVSNVFGDFTFRYVDGAFRLDAFQATPDFGKEAVRRRLVSAWGPGLISDGFAANVAAVAGNRMDALENGGASLIGAYPESGSFSGGLLHEMLYAFAADRSAFSFSDASGRSVSGTLDRGLAAALAGRIVHGPFMAARGVALEAMSNIEDRLAADRLRHRRRAAGSDRAVASVGAGGGRYGEFWAGAMRVRQDAGSADGVDGYGYDGTGLQVGYDRERGPARLGAAFAHVKGGYRDKGAAAHDSTIGSYTFDVYGSYVHREGWFASAVMGYSDSHNRLRERRGDNWDAADYDLGVWHGAVKVGYDYVHDDRFGVAPSIGFSYMKSEADGHDWRYAGVALMRYRGIRNHVVGIPVGVAVDYGLDLKGFGRLDLNARLGYTRNLRRGEAEGRAGLVGMVGAVPVEVAGRGAGPNEYSLGGGLSYRRGEWELGLRYLYRRGSEYSSHAFSGTLGASF